MKNENRTHRPRTLITLTLIALMTASLSCSLPALPFLSGSGSTEEALGQTLQDSGLLFVEEISITEELVRIEYPVLLEDNPDVMAAGWLNALMAAYQAAPDAGSYQLGITLNEDPYLEITAQGLDLKGLANEDLTGEEFLDRLEVVDLRPAASQALILLEPLGLALDEVSLRDGILSISYWPEPAADEADLMGEWWSIFEALAELRGDVDAVEIRNLMIDGSTVSVLGDTSGLDSYLAGEITAIQYLVGLEVALEEYRE